MTAPRNWRQIPSAELQTIVSKHESRKDLETLVEKQQKEIDQIRIELAMLREEIRSLAVIVRG